MLKKLLENTIEDNDPCHQFDEFVIEKYSIVRESLDCQGYHHLSYSMNSFDSESDSLSGSVIVDSNLSCIQENVKKSTRFYVTKFREGKQNLLILGSVVELWLIVGYLRSLNQAADFALCCPEVAYSIPSKVSKEKFRDYRKVYIAPVRQTEFLINLAQLIGDMSVPLVKMSLPTGYTTILGFLKSKPSCDVYFDLVDGARSIKKSCLDEFEVMDLKPVNVEKEFLKKHLYYGVIISPSDSQCKHKNEKHIEFAYLKSNRELVRFRRKYVLKKGDTSLDFWLLDDGVVVADVNISAYNRTWSSDSIRRYLKNDVVSREIKYLVRTVNRYLESKVLLPNAQDYLILSYVVVATYCQSIFDSVPIILINGVSDSGKTELAKAMIDVSANARMVGQASVASIAREVNSLNGLIALDDMDDLYGRRIDKQKRELIQQLKQGYKKESSIRVVSDGNKGKTLTYNFFGIKIITNTTSLDDITLTRSLVINSKHVADHKFKELIRKRKFEFDSNQQQNLRDDCHVFVFENAVKISDAYNEIMKNGKSRRDEILAPLRALAKISGDPNSSRELEKSLQNHLKPMSSIPGKRISLLETVEVLFSQGYHSLTTQHIALEFSYLNGLVTKQESTVSIGKKLSKMNLISTKQRSERIVVGKKKLRVYEINSQILSSKSIDESDRADSQLTPDQFCLRPRAGACTDCRYRNLRCVLKDS